MRAWGGRANEITSILIWDPSP